jgi:hypothetical protein
LPDLQQASTNVVATLGRTKTRRNTSAAT